MTQTYKEISEIVNTVLGIKTTPVAIANAANGYQSESMVGQLPALTGTLTVAETFLALVKTIPGLGTSLAVADLGANITSLVVDLKDDGVVNISTVASVASSIAAVAAVAAVAATAPVIAILGTIVSVGFGIYALASGDDTVDLANVFDSLQENLVQLTDDVFSTLGNAFDNIKSFIDSINIDFEIPTSFADLFALVGASSVRRDPLVLDLDGDGIETVNADAGIVFDHNADGLKQGTGWVAADDGMLVLDRNANGAIDSGRELFGDNTLLSDGSTARSGFAALRDYDSNGDGLIDENDTIYSQLQVWQDANQDGISQANELKTLADLGITSIGVNEREETKHIQNGNEIDITAQFTRNGESFDIGQINYSTKTFNSEFTDTIELSEQAKNLPDMQGSGGLRSLREAASTNADLATALENFASATTREQQQALLDEVIWQWSLTSETHTSYDSAVSYNESAEYINNNPGEGVIYAAIFSLDNFKFNAGGAAEGLGKLTIMEAFNGSHFGQETNVRGILFTDALVSDDRKFSSMVLQSTASRYNQDLINEVYDNLSNSIYDSLVLQTRLKPYLDGIDLVFSADGEITWDHSEAVSLIEAKITSDQTNGLIDLIELTKFSGQELLSKDFDIVSYLEQTLNGVQLTAEQNTLLAEAGLVDTTTANNDILFATENNDNVTGNAGNDILYGLAGNDSLNGGDGNDILVGGVGNDTLSGGNGNDVYLFGRGDGQDIIRTGSLQTGNDDILQLKQGISTEDVILTRDGFDLVIQIKGTTDKVVISYYFYDDANSEGAIDTIKFDDGTQWNIETIKQMMLEGFDSDNNIWAYDSNDNIIGTSADEIIEARGGDDVINAGAGNDSITGGEGNDIYLFGRGDGQDIIYNSNHYNHKDVNDSLDILRFKAGVNADDIILTRQGDYLLLQIAGTTDQITIKKYFNRDDVNDDALDVIEFENGTSWDIATVRQMMISGFNSTDSIIGYASDDVITGRETNDYILAGKGNDIINAKSGDDNVYGDAGDDILNGGKGNDSLTGGEGVDTYQFSLGGGEDIVKDFEVGETLQFLTGMSKDNIHFSRDGVILFITTDTGDKITVNNFFNEGYKNNKVIFDDGTLLSGQDVANLFYQATNENDELYGNYDNATLNGLGGDDLLWGGSGDDVLNGGSGDDVLFGNAGEDILDGGAGNDTLYGGASSDTYLFGRGGGQDIIYNNFTGIVGKDTLLFADDVLSSDVILTRTGNDLVINIKDTDDQIKIDSYFIYGEREFHEMDIKFADGESWNFDTIKQMMLNGYDSDNNIVGYDSDDVINGNDEAETIVGNAGNDVIKGNGGADTIRGDRGNDLLEGGEGNDKLFGDEGSDTLNGGKGDDILRGGFGDDTYVFSQGDGKDTIIESNNEENVNITLKLENINADDVIYRRQGRNLVLTFLNSSEDKITINDYFYARYQTTNKSLSLFINGEDQNFTDEILQDKLIMASVLNDNIEADDRDNIINGLAGDDVIFGNNGNDILSGGSGNDTLYGANDNDNLNGGIGDDTLDGGYGNDTLLGELGNDTLLGNVGDDFLNGGLGNDTLKGGSGNDVYTFTKGDGVDFVKDENGIDRFEFTDISSTEVSIRRNDYDNLVLTFANSDDQITIDNQFYYGLSSQDFAGIESFTFADGVTWQGSDIYTQALKGSDNNDTIYAFNFADTIHAGLGDDVIYAESGDDIVYGDAGNDIITLGFGNDKVWGGDGDDVITVHNPDDNTIGEDGNNQLFGDAGNDTLTGGTGNDTLEGGTGIDTLTGNEGNDTLKGGDGADILAGNTGNDILQGDAGDDTLKGGAGDDQLFGGEGNDTLEAGFGADILNGGAGDDTLISFDDNSDRSNKTLIGGKGNDTLYGSFGDDTYQFNLGDGQDTIIETRTEQAYSNYAASNDTLVFGEGISVDDLAFERHGDNLLIKVGSGDDSITIENWFKTYTEHFLVNTLQFNDGSSLNVEQVNNLVVQVGTNGDEQLVGSENSETLSGLGGNDQLFAQGGDDVLLGGTGDDYLDAGTGNDRLEGGAGNDQLRGKAGDDLFIGGTGDDAYIIDANEGHDVLDVSDGGQDVLYLQNINKNQLTFSQDGDDLLINVDDGSTQSIRIKNHFLGGDSAIDFVQTGDNQLLSTTDINQLANAGSGSTDPQPSVITGTDAAEQLAGTSDNDTINGLAGNDQLSGLAGDDVLNGGLGDDTLIGGTGNDSYVIAANDGHDQINTADGGTDTLIFEGINREQVSFAQVDNDLLINVGDGSSQSIRVLGYFNGGEAELDSVQFANGEQLSAANINQLISDANGNGDGGNNGGDTTPPDTGNTTPNTGGDDQITGAATNDILVGGAGNDRLTGGAGNDQLFGGSGDDTFVFAKGDGQDVIEVNTGTNVLEFTDNISWNDVASGLSKYGNDLILNIAGGSDKVTIKDFFTYGTSVLDDIKFADGSNLTPAQIFGAFGLAMPTETPAADVAVQYGDLTDNTLMGTAGDDIINGQSGNDTLTGGLGNDTLIGGQGDDTFVINSGDGQDIIDGSGGGVDTVLFKNGISFNDIASSLMKKGNDLQLGSGSSQVTIRNFFLGGDFAIDNFTFESGGQISAAQIFGAFGLATPNIAETDQSVNLPDLSQFAQVIQGDANDQGLYGSSDDELLLASAGNDTLSGGAGNDTLIGGLGNDVYQFALGDGQDVINNYDNGASNSDVLQFAANIASSDVSVTRNNDDLFLTVNGSDDKITVQNYFANNGVSDYALSAITFTDGTSWAYADINALLPSAAPQSNRLSSFMSLSTESNDLLADDNEIFEQPAELLKSRLTRPTIPNIPETGTVIGQKGFGSIELPPVFLEKEFEFEMINEANESNLNDLSPVVNNVSEFIVNEDTLVRELPQSELVFDNNSGLFGWPAEWLQDNSPRPIMPNLPVTGTVIGQKGFGSIELPPVFLEKEFEMINEANESNLNDLSQVVNNASEFIVNEDTLVRELPQSELVFDNNSGLFGWPAEWLQDNSLKPIMPNLPVTGTVIGQKGFGSIELPPVFLEKEFKFGSEYAQVDVALNQLIQAYSGFDDAGEEIEMGKYDNNYRHILPVLETM